MSWWQAILLGVIQGVTEFLPVSSSGHLALTQMLLPGFRQPGVLFDALLHVGTASAVVWAERRQLRRWLGSSDGLRLGLLLVLGTLATAAVAFPLRDLAEGAFTRPTWVGYGLLLTGVVVLSTRWLPGGPRTESCSGVPRVLLVGLAQGVAVFPGISRSGSTIAVGLAVGFDRAWAARFSFLLSIPAIAGATLVELLGARDELQALGQAFWGPALVGTVAAAVSGLIALRVVLRTVTSRSFHRFAWYCLPLGALVLALSLGGVL